MVSTQMYWWPGLSLPGSVWPRKRTWCSSAREDQILCVHSLWNVNYHRALASFLNRNADMKQHVSRHDGASLNQAFANSREKYSNVLASGAAEFFALVCKMVG
ncbi:unnamed protein product [Polarella glacialis]|uniref:Uncharacterized protein n=1 Tax=Polarella glacialis TaxID=89957 RepID=A0A813IR91_POLGL|nr:unnamed protein product [Polarella glacialis]